MSRFKKSSKLRLPEMQRLRDRELSEDASDDCF